MQNVKEACFLRILTPRREPGHKEGLLIWKKYTFWEFCPPGGSLVTKKSYLIWKKFVFWEFWTPEWAVSQKKGF